MSIETKVVGAAVVSSVAGVSVSLEYLGVPTSVVLFAFLGAAGILSFMPKMPVMRMLGTVFFCAFAAMGGSGVAIKQIDALAGFQPLAALVIAALLQLFVPWAIDNRALIADKLLSLVPGRGTPPSGGDR